MIVDKIPADKAAEEPTELTSPPPKELPSVVAEPPSYFDGSVEEGSPSSSAGPSSSWSTAYTPSPSVLSSPFDSKRTPLPQPLLLPPLYPPSSTSPFLLAYAPSLEAAGISRDSWLELIESINDSLKINPVLSVVRTTESVIDHIPGINWAVGVCKQVIVGGFFFGMARGAAAVVEGGTQGKVGLKIAKARSAAFGNHNAPVPSSTHALLDRANSVGGIFPPSSGLLITLVPSHLLPILLSQYPPLPNLPPQIAAHLTKSAIETSNASITEVSMERRKALKVRSRIDFRRWGWLTLEHEANEGAESVDLTPIKTVGSALSSTSSPVDSCSPTSTFRPPSRTLSSISSSGMAAFSHLDEKLQARQSRKSLGKPATRFGVDSKGRISETRPAMGYELAEEKMGSGTMFLVVVRRGLIGLEMAEEF